MGTLRGKDENWLSLPPRSSDAPTRDAPHFFHHQRDNPSMRLAHTIELCLVSEREPELEPEPAVEQRSGKAVEGKAALAPADAPLFFFSTGAPTCPHRLCSPCAQAVPLARRSEQPHTS